MQDFNNFPQPLSIDRFVGPRGVNSSFVWQRPRGATMAHIFCVSFGGNGGNGFASASGGSAGGGGGGGSSNQTTLIVPLLLLPERLYVTHSTAALGSWVSVEPVYTTTSNVLIRASSGNGGTTATSGTGAGGGSGASVAIISQMPLAGLGVYHMLAGQNGASGGSTGAGSDVSLPTTGLCVTGGGGGGGHGTGSGGAGGRITGVGVYPTLPGGLATGVATTPGGNGQEGRNLGDALVEFFCGGTGGGASHSSATGAGLYAGNGGAGYFGCGGGGGGSLITGATGGQGGLGGPGLIIITAW